MPCTRSVLLHQYACQNQHWHAEKKTDGGGDGKTPGGSTTTARDDGELGSIALGMEVWDDYERELKVWEATEAAQEANASA